MSFISLHEIINAIPKTRICLWISSSAVDAVVINPSGIKTLLDNGLSTSFINGKPTMLQSYNQKIHLIALIVLFCVFGNLY